MGVQHRLAFGPAIGEPVPWVYGDWTTQGPAPERDGVPQWTVDVDVMARGDAWEWPPEFEHPDAEPLAHYGWCEVWPTYEHHLHASLRVWVTSEQAALDLAHRLVGEHFTRPYVIAHRVRAEVDGSRERVTITVHERFSLTWTEDGHHIEVIGDWVQARQRAQVLDARLPTGRNDRWRDVSVGRTRG